MLLILASVSFKDGEADPQVKVWAFVFEIAKQIYAENKIFVVSFMVLF